MHSKYFIITNNQSFDFLIRVGWTQENTHRSKDLQHWDQTREEINMFIEIRGEIVCFFEKSNLKCNFIIRKWVPEDITDLPFRTKTFKTTVRNKKQF